MDTKLIDRHDYPELDLILWDRAERWVAPDVAFRLYEERWRFVAHDRLDEGERELIRRLTVAYGRGHMLVA
ncbi:hypothetical protein [Halomonas sp. E19]|uniref:hypothetical protein n=1 Tax=Halomonas sp. E19 TaxID=3397247 RepID=UPI004033FB31